MFSPEEAAATIIRLETCIASSHQQLEALRNTLADWVTAQSAPGSLLLEHDGQAYAVQMWRRGAKRVRVQLLARPVDPE